MAKQKYFYYVGVRVKSGMAFVTKTNNVNRWATWDVEKEPCQFCRSSAISICEGLCLKGFDACVIQTLYPWDSHAVSVKDGSNNA